MEGLKTKTEICLVEVYLILFVLGLSKVSALALHQLSQLCVCTHVCVYLSDVCVRFCVLDKYMQV